MLKTHCNVSIDNQTNIYIVIQPSKILSKKSSTLCTPTPSRQVGKDLIPTTSSSASKPSFKVNNKSKLPSKTLSTLTTSRNGGKN